MAIHLGASGKKLAEVPINGQAVLRSDVYLALRGEAMRRGVTIEYKLVAVVLAVRHHRANPFPAQPLVAAERGRGRGRRVPDEDHPVPAPGRHVRQVVAGLRQLDLRGGLDDPHRRGPVAP